MLFQGLRHHFEPATVCINQVDVAVADFFVRSRVLVVHVFVTEQANSGLSNLNRLEERLVFEVSPRFSSVRRVDGVGVVGRVSGDVQRIAELVDPAWRLLKLVKTRFDFVYRVVDLRRNTCGYFAVEEVVLVPVLVTGTSPVTAIYVCRLNRRASIFVGDGNSVRGCDLGAVFRFNGRNVRTNRGRRVCEVQRLP